MSVVSLGVVNARAVSLRASVRSVSPGRLLLTVVAGALFALGWLAGKVSLAVSVVVRGLWFAVSWCAAAVAVGWSQARGRPEGAVDGPA